MATDLSSSHTASQWSIPLARCVVWEACTPDGETVPLPALSFVEPTLRRRLSTLAKISLHVAFECCHDIPNPRMVYASRHGDSVRATRMLEDLADNTSLSPTAFSMSVLNASTGLFSIIQNIQAPATAIAAGAASFGYGLLEASLQLAAHPTQPVLFVYADEPVPEVFGEPELSRFKTHAIALLLESSAPRTLRCTTAPTTDHDSTESLSHSFLRGLSHAHASWNGAGLHWSWQALTQPT